MWTSGTILPLSFKYLYTASAVKGKGSHMFDISVWYLGWSQSWAVSS